MQTLLFMLLAVLLILELTKWKIVRVFLVFGIVFALLRTVAEYQKDIRLCHMDEEATVKLIVELGSNDCQRVVHAAHEYLHDLNAANYEKPFPFGFSRYVTKQGAQIDSQPAEGAYSLLEAVKTSAHSKRCP